MPKVGPIDLRLLAGKRLELQEWFAELRTQAGIVAHNHPSGSLEPSAEDLQVTRRLVDCGKLLGVEVLDHVIVTAESYVSLREKGVF